MTTTTRTKAASATPAKSGIHVFELHDSIALTAGPSQNDIIKVFKLAPGTTVLDVILTATDLDTHNTPTITIDVGDSGSATRYIAASTVAQAGGVARAAAAVPYNYSAEDYIQIKFSAAAATWANGTIGLTVICTPEQ